MIFKVVPLIFCTTSAILCPDLKFASSGLGLWTTVTAPHAPSAPSGPVTLLAASRGLGAQRYPVMCPWVAASHLVACRPASACRLPWEGAAHPAGRAKSHLASRR